MNDMGRSTMVVAIAALVAQAAAAQVAPDSGALLREAEKAVPKPSPNMPLRTPSPAPSEEGQGPSVLVTRFEFTGVKLLSSDEVQAVVRAWVGKRATMQSLRNAADAIAVEYGKRGYLARAYLPEQDVAGGVVRIAVVEGVLSDITVERTDAPRALPDALVKQTMLARQALGAPVRPDALQRAITLLNEVPGTRAASVIEPGAREGESRLIVSVRGTPLVTGSASVDNTGALATGEARTTLNLAVNSPLHMGDQWQLTGNVSSGSRYARGGALLPVGSDGLRVQGYASGLNYGYDLNAVRYSGSADVIGVASLYPLRRDVSANVTVQVSAEQKTFKNEVGGIQLNDKQLNLLTLALNGDRQDEWAGGGLWLYALQLAVGRLDLSGNAADLAVDQTAGGPLRQGHFTKWNASASRLQQLSAAQSVNVSVALQKSSKNLDSAEKLQMTGWYGVRAYGVSEPSVDTGVLLNADWRYQLKSGYTVSLFHDQALGWRDAGANTATLAPNRFHLSGSGVGLSGELPGAVQFRLSLAWRHGTNPTRNPVTLRDADGTQRETRVFASLSKGF